MSGCACQMTQMLSSEDVEAETCNQKQVTNMLCICLCFWLPCSTVTKWTKNWSQSCDEGRVKPAINRHPRKQSNVFIGGYLQQNKQGEWKNTCWTLKRQQTAGVERVKNDHSLGPEPSQAPVVWGKHILIGKQTWAELWSCVLSHKSSLDLCGKHPREWQIVYAKEKPSVV